MLAAQAVDLPDAWPACRVAHCGSTAARARIEAPFEPVELACENGHFRGYARTDDFRRGGRYAGLFAPAVLPLDAARGGLEGRLDPGVRRRSEVLEDAERCALCGTPPAEHPYRPGDAVRSDREITAWLMRFRPAVFAEVAEATAIARAAGARGGWRLTMAPRVREVVVDALQSSSLTTEHVVPPAYLAPVADALSKRELDIAVNHLLVAMCRPCAEARRSGASDLRATIRAYVVAVHGGDETLARADRHRFDAVERIASLASGVVVGTARSA